MLEYFKSLFKPYAYHNDFRFGGDAYCIAISSMPQSMEVAKRCAESGKKVGVKVELFSATTKDESAELLKKEGLEWTWQKKSKSNLGAVFGCFLSHYRLWQMAVEKDKTILVLEHDAVFTGPLPDIAFDGLLNLGAPSWGKKPRSQASQGLSTLTTKKLHGTHGYFVSPRGAKKLIASARAKGVWPEDQFLSRRRFPFIQEYLPHPIKAIDEFSTIQKTDLGRGYKTVDEMWKT